MNHNQFTLLAVPACLLIGCASPEKPAASIAPAPRCQTNYVLVPAETDARTGRVFPAEERIVLIPVP